MPTAADGSATMSALTERADRVGDPFAPNPSASAKGKAVSWKKPLAPTAR